MVNFSPAQREASEYAVRFVQKPEHHKSRLLIWAVTGAGKTEILFQAIHQSLLLGKAVLIVTPRKDIVIELTPRLQKVFPQQNIVSLHGESLQKGEISLLVIATTHQALNLYHYFDLVIVDEVDAFPYHNNPMLHQAVEQAQIQNGQMIYLTATPTDTLLRQVRQGKVEQIIIPIRHHGHPLVIPKVKINRRIQKQIDQNLLPTEIQQFIKHLEQSKRQGLLFVPKIEWISPIVKMIQNHVDQSGWVDGVFANDTNRSKKVEDFRAGKIRLLVTTTILERGVTIPSIDCLVCKADSPIFDESTLVQISGRVGRTIEDPRGLLVFLSEARTQAIVQAIRQIKRMNRIAKRKGYLKQVEGNEGEGSLQRVIAYIKRGFE